MSYNHEAFPRYVRTAGKITIVTAISGLLVFLVAFVFDVGTQELNKVSAQTATTTLTVLNVPPTFTINAYEVTESSTTTPTNSGDNIVWAALGNDSNGAPYFLLVCSNSATPTANAAAGPGSLGTAPPTCHGTAVTWGVSTGTPSDTLATVSTTTTEAAPFAEVNSWYAWVCDDDPNFPRCNDTPVQGYSATNSSPFHVNSRPILSAFGNNGPVDPGATITFTSTSSDPDTTYNNNIYLVVCSTNSDYNATTNTCPNDLIASTTSLVTDNATSSYSVVIPTRDQSYDAFAYLVDEFGHEALANPIQVNFDINNVPPYVLGGDIILNGGLDITSLLPGIESIPASTTLAFTVKDNNSCLNAASGDEIVDFDVVVFRSDLGTTTCDGTGANYDPNNCYDNALATTTWNLSCTPDAACPNATTTDMSYSCTFPLWFLADPTDNAVNIPASLASTTWSAGVAGIDDDAATGSMSTSSIAVDLISSPAIDILANAIVYGSIAPGDDSGTLSATSTILNIGNTGLDQNTKGESMCGTFAVGNECPVSATSTIPENQQQYSSTTLAYGSPLAVTLSSTTDNEVELDVLKTTATSSASWQTGTTYWGIAVPASITLSGSYTGLNTFSAVTAEAIDWY